MAVRADGTRTPRRHGAAAGVVDVAAYVVVLNLFIEHLPQVISEGFTLSLLTAVLLKGVLEVVVLAKNRAKNRFRRATTPAGKLVGAVALWLVLFGSKFLVLKLVALVFGSRVSLGGFFSVTLLIVALLLSRAGVRRLLDDPRARVGQPAGGPEGSPAPEPPVAGSRVRRARTR